MRILAVDIGTGTQDILLFDTTTTPENCYKLVMPSPTTMLASQVRRATRQRRPVVLTGTTMGGGPVHWAIEDHLHAGLAVYATPLAGQTFNDDLAEVERMGIRLISEDEARGLGNRALRLHLCDLNLASMARAFRSFGVRLQYDALAIAVLDHGSAPPGVSDRTFRFDHIRRIIQERPVPDTPYADLHAFAYLAGELPAYLTRMRAVVASVGPCDVPFILVDTGAAAALGALEDPMVAGRESLVLVNIGNMHTLATHLEDGRVVGLFEHHTGALTTQKLDGYLRDLVSGVLDHATIFNDMGHGCYIVRPCRSADGQRPFLAVTGPRRSLAYGSVFHPYFAAPHGDMMMAGCFGLIRAAGARLPQWREEIEQALSSGRRVG